MLIFAVFPLFSGLFHPAENQENNCNLSGILQVELDQLFNLVHPVKEGCAMDKQLCRGLLYAEIIGVILIQRFCQEAVRMLLIIPDQEHPDTAP